MTEQPGGASPLDNPLLVYVQIAIDQLDGNRDFFKNAVPEAVKDVKDAALVAEFKKTDDPRNPRGSAPPRLSPLAPKLEGYPSRGVPVLERGRWPTGPGKCLFRHL